MKNAHHLGDCEEKGAKILLGEQAGGLGQAFRQVGAAACTMRAPTEAQAERLAKRFRAPLRQSLQYVRAAKEQIDARLDALKLQACRQVQSKRAKLEQALRPTDATAHSADDDFRPSPPPSAAHPVTGRGITTRRRSRRIRRRNAQKKYDDIKSCMTNELPRVHAELEQSSTPRSEKPLHGSRCAAARGNPCFRAPPTAPPPRERTTHITIHPFNHTRTRTRTNHPSTRNHPSTVPSSTRLSTSR